MLTNATSADISTRFTRQAQTVEEVTRLGQHLGATWVRAVRNASPSGPTKSSTPTLQVAAEDVNVKLKTPPNPGEAARVLRACTEAYEAARQENVPAGVLRDLWTRVEGAKALWQMSLTRNEPSSRTFIMTGLRLGGVTYLFIPGEVFSSTFRAWRQTINTTGTWRVVTLANGYFGYFPTMQATQEQFYEALTSPFDSHATDALGATAAALLQALWPHEELSNK